MGIENLSEFPIFVSVRGVSGGSGIISEGGRLFLRGFDGLRKAFWGRGFDFSTFFGGTGTFDFFYEGDFCYSQGGGFI